ncbi:P-loop containing nucleoside triphosphate hydrolase protein [Pelagophyceae sp. CCMP2097]|nr:P-loop containing nucleoside triphosphate hydrolase protein [Pelagophyceae sp. CCMP2097]
MLRGVSRRLYAACLIDAAGSRAYAPSVYQVAVMEWVRSGAGHGVISAKAGSGKTSMLVSYVAPLLGGTTVVFCAFNKHVKEELEKRLSGRPNVFARTIHGMGCSAIIDLCQRMGRPPPRVDQNKYKLVIDTNLGNRLALFETELAGLLHARQGAKLAQSAFDALLLKHQLDVDAFHDPLTDGPAPLYPSILLRDDLLADGQPARLRRDVFAKGFKANLASTAIKLCSKLRITLTPPSDDGAVLELAQRFGLSTESCFGLAVSLAREAMATGLLETWTSIDFDDMIYIPAVVTQVVPKQRDWVLVDECQDLNAAQLATVRKASKADGRFLFVGDEQQAIYGFAGADAGSFQTVIDSFQATVLPLSVCYRCPTSHIDLVRKIVPDIEAAPGAKEGRVTYIEATEVVQALRDLHAGGTPCLVLCRTNARLFDVALSLYALGVPAALRGGKDLSKELAGVFIKAVRAGIKPRSRAGASKADKVDAVRNFCFGKAAAALRATSGFQDEVIWLDRAASIIAVVRSSPEGADIAAALDELGATDGPGLIQLSSVHRAKGDESDHVFVLDHDRMPLPGVLDHGQKWEIVQEWNLKYVALTRAKCDLTLVASKSSFED